MLRKIILASPRGYCAGVNRAITIVEKALEKYGKPIYVRHEIVHNEHVIGYLKKKGVIFVEELDEVPKSSIMIFSAHGVPPKIRDDAEKMGLKAIDATCPLVNKVHLEAKRFHDKGYSIILIGKKGHQEVIGTMAEAPMHLVEYESDVSNLKMKGDKIVYLMQTTLSLDETRHIVDALKKKFPNISSPPNDDICYATQNRQNAVKELAKHSDLILVVGSTTSSNSKRLVETARLSGKQSYLVPDRSGVKDDWLKSISSLGITSGASVPEFLVQELVDSIKSRYPSVKVETLECKKENTVFTLPFLLAE